MIVEARDVRFVTFPSRRGTGYSSRTIVRFTGCIESAHSGVPHASSGRRSSSLYLLGVYLLVRVVASGWLDLPQCWLSARNYTGF